MNFTKGKVIAVRLGSAVVQYPGGRTERVPVGLHVRQPPGRTVLVGTDGTGRSEAVSGKRD